MDLKGLAEKDPEFFEFLQVRGWGVPKGLVVVNVPLPRRAGGHSPPPPV